MIGPQLYRITQGDKYIILKNSDYGPELDYDEEGRDSGLNLLFSSLLEEGKKAGEVPVSGMAKAPERRGADIFLEWVRTKHPEIEFEAEYIGPDDWLCYEDDYNPIPDHVKVDENGHWFDKETGEDIDWQRILEEESLIRKLIMY